MYPREQRLRDYNKVLETYAKNTLSGFSICERLIKVIEFPVNEQAPRCTTIHKEYPELASFRPLDCLDNEYWFDSNEDRVNCLKKCIEMLEFQVGDKVTVTRKATREELKEVGDLYWAEAMDYWVGLECEVTMTLYNGKLQLNLKGENWVFPECIVEKVSTSLGSPSTNKDNSSTNVEFKLGDTVEIIGNKNHSANKVGDIGVITETRGLEVRVQVVNGPESSNWSNLKDLKLKISRVVMKTIVNNVEIELTEEQIELIESKQLPTSWEQTYRGTGPEWYAAADGNVETSMQGMSNDHTNVTTEVRAKSVVAYCKLSVIVDALNSTQPLGEDKWTVEFNKNNSKLYTDYWKANLVTNPLTLHTRDLAEHLKSHFEKLLLDYYMIKN